MKKVTWEGKELRKDEYVSLAHCITLYLEIAFCAESCSKGFHLIAGRRFDKLSSKVKQQVCWTGKSCIDRQGILPL